MRYFISLYISYSFPLPNLLERDHLKQKYKNNFIPNDSSFLKDSNETEYGALALKHCFSALPPPAPHTYFICRYFRQPVMGRGGWGTGHHIRTK